MTGVDEAGEHEPGEQEERRRRVMERLAEILQGPPPESTGGGGATAGGVEAAIGQLGLGLSDEDRAKVAGVMGEASDPEEAAALFMAMFEGFQAWQRRPRHVEAETAAETETGPDSNA